MGKIRTDGVRAFVPFPLSRNTVLRKKQELDARFGDVPVLHDRVQGYLPSTKTRCCRRGAVDGNPPTTGGVDVRTGLRVTRGTRITLLPSSFPNITTKFINIIMTIFIYKNYLT